MTLFIFLGESLLLLLFLFFLLLVINRRHRCCCSPLIWFVFLFYITTLCFMFVESRNMFSSGFFFLYVIRVVIVWKQRLNFFMCQLADCFFLHVNRIEFNHLSIFDRISYWLSCKRIFNSNNKRFYRLENEIIEFFMYSL